MVRDRLQDLLGNNSSNAGGPSSSQPAEHDLEMNDLGPDGPEPVQPGLGGSRDQRELTLEEFHEQVHTLLLNWG